MDFNDILILRIHDGLIHGTDIRGSPSEGY